MFSNLNALCAMMNAQHSQANEAHNILSDAEPILRYCLMMFLFYLYEFLGILTLSSLKSSRISSRLVICDSKSFIDSMSLTKCLRI